jgi:HEAT repeat protein
MIPGEQILGRIGVQRGQNAVKLFLIGSFAVIALLITLYGVMLQYDGIFLERYYLIPHLYIIPIIFVALWYPRRGTQVVILLIASIAVLTGLTFFIRHTIDPVLSLLNAGVDVWIVAALALTARSRAPADGIPSVPFYKRGGLSGLGVRAPERSIEGYLEALKLPDGGIRQEAVKALADFAEPLAIRVLVNALHDESGAVREEAIRSLGKISHPDTIPPLLEILTDRNRLVREQAVKALGGKGSMAVPPLLESLSNMEWHVRMGSAIALRIIGDKRAVEPLIQLLSDENRFVRREAVKSLGRLGDQRAQNPLLNLRGDPDQTVRMRAEMALMKIHGKHFTADELNKYTDKIEKL